MYVCIHIHVYHNEYMCHGKHMKVREQPQSLSSPPTLLETRFLDLLRDARLPDL